MRTGPLAPIADAIADWWLSLRSTYHRTIADPIAGLMLLVVALQLITLAALVLVVLL